MTHGTSTRPISLMSWIHDLRAGGAETSLLVELRALRERGFDVSVGIVGHDLTLAPQYAQAGITIHELGSGSLLRRGRRLFKTLRAERPDMVEVILFWPNLFVRPLARLLGIKVVTQLANEEYSPAHRARSRYGPAGVIASQLADAATSPFANHFRAVSAGVKTAMAKRLLIPSKRIDVVHVARELSVLGRRDPQRRARIRQELNVSEDRFVVLMTGRQDIQKDQATAIRALGRLLESSDNITVVLAGRSGDNSPDVHSAITALAPGADVRLLGVRSDVPDLLCGADCFLMPSLWEGFSGAVVEAMALEVPMVLSDISAMREVARENAWYFPVKDDARCAELLAQVANGTYPTALIEGARARVEQDLDVDAIADQLADLYHSVLGNR